MNIEDNSLLINLISEVSTQQNHKSARFRAYFFNSFATAFLYMLLVAHLHVPENISKRLNVSAEKI